MTTDDSIPTRPLPDDGPSFAPHVPIVRPGTGPVQREVPVLRHPRRAPTVLIVGTLAVAAAIAGVVVLSSQEEQMPPPSVETPAP